MESSTKKLKIVECNWDKHYTVSSSYNSSGTSQLNMLPEFVNSVSGFQAVCAFYSRRVCQCEIMDEDRTALTIMWWIWSPVRDMSKAYSLLIRASVIRSSQLQTTCRPKPAYKARKPFCKPAGYQTVFQYCPAKSPSATKSISSQHCSDMFSKSMKCLFCGSTLFRQFYVHDQTFVLPLTSQA